MTRILVVAGLLLGLMPPMAFAQSGLPQIANMELVTTEGPYRFNDGGVAVDGYIERPAVGGMPDMTPIRPDAIVSFRVCNSKDTMPVVRKSLTKGTCSSPGGPGPFPWAAWLLRGDHLIASAPGGAVKTVPLANFPTDWKTLIEAGPTGEVRALSLPSTSGESLAVIVKPSS